MNNPKLSYSIVITTFDRRFESHFIPLVEDVFDKPKSNYNDIIVMVNGPHCSDFNQDYRKQILFFLSKYKNVYPTIFPNFQSLSKLWNRGILTSLHEVVLVLNDDLRLKPKFFEVLEEKIASNSGSFRINESFSHYVIYKQELIDVGFFDERLLGLGEEDGDFVWRYYKKYAKEFPSVEIPYIDNIQSDIADPGYSKGIRTASKFNREFILNNKYRRSIFGHKGMFDYKVAQRMEDQTQYPYENFYREHLKDL